MKTLENVIANSGVASANELTKGEIYDLAQEIREWMLSMSDPVEGMLGEEETDEVAMHENVIKRVADDFVLPYNLSQGE